MVPLALGDSRGLKAVSSTNEQHILSAAPETTGAKGKKMRFTASGNRDGPSNTNIQTGPSAVLEEEDEYPTDQDEEDEHDAARKVPKISDKRKEQNRLFSAWSATLEDSRPLSLTHGSIQGTKARRKSLERGSCRCYGTHRRWSPFYSRLNVKTRIVSHHHWSTGIPARAFRKGQEREHYSGLRYRSVDRMAITHSVQAKSFTGSGKTYIAVLLLKHVIDQELENRSMGKKRRISFFLVSSCLQSKREHAD